MKTSRSNQIRAVVLAIIFAFATAFSPLLGADQRNYLVILLSAFSIPLMVYLGLGIGKDLIWLLVVLLGQFFLILVNGTWSELNTLAYTGMLASAYLAVARGLHTGYVTRDAVLKILKSLIFLYAIFSVLQMAASLQGLPIPNLILSKGVWSYNSLAPEPSQAARALALSILTYLILARDRNDKIGLRELLSQHKFVVAAFLISIGLTGSGTGFIAAPLAITLILSKTWVLAILSGLFLAWPALYTIDFPAIQRASAFLATLPTMDISALVEADHSGAMRVMPLLIFFDEAQPASLQFWFGGGMGAIATYLQGKLIGAGDLVGAGFIPGYIMAFGVVGTLTFLWAFVLRFLVPATRPVALLWLIFFATSPWNTQFFWYGLMLVRIVHELQRVQMRKTTLKLRPMSPSTSGVGE